MFVAKVTPSSTHGSPASKSSSSSTAAEPTPFHSTDEAKTLSELLLLEQKLADHAGEYARLLESAGMDAELAADLELADLREILPAAPIAHCLLIKRILAARSTVKPVIPNTPEWKWTARVVANGVREGSIKELSAVKHELDLITGSLFLSFAISQLLAPPDSCVTSTNASSDDEGSMLEMLEPQPAPCPTLLAADMILWATLTVALLLCVVASWSIAQIEQAVSSASMAKWVATFWRFYNIGAGLLVTSFTFLLPLALATRTMILLNGHPAYPWWLAWTVATILVVGTGLVVYGWWVSLTTRTFGVRLVDFPAFNLGLLGVRMPLASLKRASQQARVPFFE